MRRQFVSAGLVLAATVTASTCFRKPAATAPCPNVLIVLVDALRDDVVGSRAPSPVTPHLDELAGEGVRFERTWTTATWTKPAVASLFTGLYPSRHGVHLVAKRRQARFEGEVLDDGLTTLAERFREAGWTTGGVVNQVHLSRRDGFAQGFAGYAHKRGAVAPGLNRQFRRWLDARAAEPFFAYVHYLDVHWPYSQSLEDSALPDPEPVEPGDMPACLIQPQREHPECPRVVTEWLRTEESARIVEQLRLLYAREVEFTDAAVGDLFAELRRRGLWDRTIVVVTSDHGEGFGEHERLQHGYTPWEEVARIPLLLRLPAWYEIPPGTVETPASLIDLYPTLLELAGIEVPRGLDGESLVPVLRGAVPGERTLLVESPNGVAAIRNGTKLLRDPAGRIRLYNLNEDADERLAIRGPCVGMCAELISALDADDHRQRNLTTRRQLREDELRELEALGYL